MARYDAALPAGMHPELGTLCATLIDGTREWRENLGRVGEAALIWQPHEEGPSIGGVLLHMIDCEGYWLKEFADGVPVGLDHPATRYGASLDQDRGRWPKPPRKRLAWYYSLQDEVRAETLERVLAHNDPEREYKRGKNLFTYRWILAHVVEHDSYHGGQAVLLHEMIKRLRR